MDWTLLTALSIVSRSIYGVMTKVLSTKVHVSVYTQAFLLPLAGAVVAILFSPLLGGLDLSFSKVNLIIVFLVVVGQGLGNIVYFASIKDLTNATAQIASSSILIFNTLLALTFLNLHLNIINIVGLFILIFAILLVVSGKVEFHIRGVALMILSAFLFAVFQLASSELSKQVSASTYLLIAYLGASGVVFVFRYKTVIKDIRKSENLKTILGIPTLTALPSIGYFLFAYYAYRVAPKPSIVAMLLTSQVVLTVILSYFFLHEKGHIKRKIFAAILVVIASILIKS